MGKSDIKEILKDRIQEVPGLCYSGTHDCTNNKIEYVLFMRNEHDKNNITNEQKVHTMYRNKVFHKFVIGVRTAYIAD